MNGQVHGDLLCRGGRETKHAHAARAVNVVGRSGLRSVEQKPQTKPQVIRRDGQSRLGHRLPSPTKAMGASSPTCMPHTMGRPCQSKRNKPQGGRTSLGLLDDFQACFSGLDLFRLLWSSAQRSSADRGLMVVSQRVWGTIGSQTGVGVRADRIAGGRGATAA